MQGLGITAAAARLGITERTLYTWIKRDKVKTIPPTATTPRLVSFAELNRLAKEPKKRDSKALAAGS